MHSSGNSVNWGFMLGLGSISIWSEIFWILSIVCKWLIHKFFEPIGFPQHFWFSFSTSCLNCTTRPRSVLICCLLVLTCIATSSIICNKIRWAPPLSEVIATSPDTSNLRSAQIYWNRRWLRTDDLKSRRLTATSSPLKPAISRVLRTTILQCGGGLDDASGSSLL